MRRDEKDATTRQDKAKPSTDEKSAMKEASCTVYERYIDVYSKHVRSTAFLYSVHQPRDGNESRKTLTSAAEAKVERIQARREM